MNFFMRALYEVPKFSVVSCATTALRVLVSTALFYCFSWFEEHYVVALAIGYVCQIITESQINIRWTFGKPEASRVKALLVTLLIELLCFGIATATVFVGLEVLDLDFVLVQLFSIPLTGVVSYTLTSHLIRQHL